MACFTSEYEISTVSSAALAKAQPVARGEGLVPSIQCLPTTLFSLERKKPRVVSLLSSSSPESPIRWLNHTILKFPGFERSWLQAAASQTVLDMKKKTLMMAVAPCVRMTREAVESPSLKILKKEIRWNVSKNQKGRLQYIHSLSLHKRLKKKVKKPPKHFWQRVRGKKS